MTTIDIPLPPTIAPERIERALLAAFADAGLSVTLDDTLRAYPGSRHWHLKLGRERGTLEATFWPKEHHAWLSVQDSRRVAWIADAISQVQATIAARLHRTSNDRQRWELNRSRTQV